MAMRLIDAKRLEANIKEAFRENPVVMGIMLRWIRKQPTADVTPVVLCRDCKYWQDNNDGYPHEECRWGGTEKHRMKMTFAAMEKGKTMDDKIPYAGMLEDGIKKLTEGKAQNAVLCGLLEDGTTCVAYANASPEDLANIACHLLSEAFMRTVIVNIDMVKDALDEYEDEEGESE